MANQITQELIPDPQRMIEGLRDTGYEFDTAIADIVDNSIAANATAVDIKVDADVRGNIHVSIADNGEGMDEGGLENAMRYGARVQAERGKLGQIWSWSENGINRVCAPAFSHFTKFPNDVSHDDHMGPRSCRQGWQVGGPDH